MTAAHGQPATLGRRGPRPRRIVCIREFALSIIVLQQKMCDPFALLRRWPCIMFVSMIGVGFKSIFLVPTVTGSRLALDEHHDDETSMHDAQASYVAS